VIDRPKQIRTRETLTHVRARGATPAELEALYRARFEAFARVAGGIVGDADAGRDAVQSAFVAAVRGRRSFRGSRLEAWVWQIVVNEARRAATRVRPIGLDEVAEPVTNGGYVEGGSEVRRWVAALPPRQREAVFLRYFADLDYRTIARILALEPGTVSATLSAAHQTLRKRLEATSR
jgi:RNA polymerase sigma factor (sigma-70 family)